MRVYDPVEEARRWLFVRETLGPNRGVFVEAIQRIGNGKPGDNWCADFVSMVLWICYQGPCALPRTGSCDVMLEVARASGLLVDTPLPGDIVFSMLGRHDAHHVGIVTASDPLCAIAGNTSADGTSSNGDGVYEHRINPKHKLFARIP